MTTIDRRQLMAGAAGVSLASFSIIHLPRPAHAAADTLTLTIGSDVGNLDPDKYTNWNDYWAYGNMFEGLYRPNENGDLAPGLAESVAISPNGLQYKFTLRAGVKFHNGDPVTTDDIVFSVQRTRDPAIQNQRASLLNNIERIEKIDDRNFVVHVKEIDADTIAKLSLYWQVKPKKYIESVGNDAFALKPVGTGPFAFVDRRRSEFLKMKAFDDFWGPKARVKEVVLKIAPEEQSRLAQVMAGETDAASPISPVLAARIATMPNLQVIRVPSFLNVLVYFGTKHPETAKKEVRQGLAMAIDRDAMLKTIMLGYAAPQELWCTSAQNGCSLDGLTAYKYDPDRARDLLKKANFDFSKPIKFVGMAPGRVAASKETCEAITDYLKRIGVQVDLQIMEFGAWNAVKQAKEKDPSIAMIYATGPDPSKDVAYKLQVNTQSQLMTSWVFDKTNDEMLTKMNSFTDMKERDAFINKLLRHYHEQAFFLPLWANDTLFVASKSLKLDVAPYMAYSVLDRSSKTS